MVSEETRAISLVYGGEIKRGLSLDDLRMEIGRVLVRGKRKRSEPAAKPA